MRTAGSRSCRWLLIHPGFDAVITVSCIDSLFSKGTAERARCLLPPAALLILMFTAPRLSTVLGALSFPADGEGTLFVGLGTL